MKTKTYIYPYIIKRTQSLKYELIPEQNKKYLFTFDQYSLFMSMLNFGYIQFSEGKFAITDKQIIEFYNYTKDNILKDVDIEQYYRLFDISAPFIRQIPTITEKETFISDSYQMTVSWENDTSTGKMKSAPRAYRRDGLEIYNFENEKLGSIYPEYYELYEIIDSANSNWKNWTKTNRYAFLEDLVNISHKRKIILSKEQVQAYEHVN